MARRIYSNKLTPLDYGLPEFVAPETANGQRVGYPADMWSVGVITYLLLSGISPLRGETDRDTLRRVQAGQINFDAEALSSISGDATDFVTKLLVFKADGRLTLEEVIRLNCLAFCDVTNNAPLGAETPAAERGGSLSCNRWTGTSSYRDGTT